MCYCPHTLWFHCVSPCSVCAVCMPVPEHWSITLGYTLNKCPAANAPENRLGSVWAHRKCVCLEERKSDEEFAQVCEGCVWKMCVCVCKCAWGLAAELAPRSPHVMLFLLPSLNISRAEDQCDEYKVTKKGLFVHFSSCRRLAVLWLLQDCHAEAQNQGEGQESGQEILSPSSLDLLQNSKANKSLNSGPPL